MSQKADLRNSFQIGKEWRGWIQDEELVPFFIYKYFCCVSDF
jgi:hypothetical protein